MWPFKKKIDSEAQRAAYSVCIELQGGTADGRKVFVQFGIVEVHVPIVIDNRMGMQIYRPTGTFSRGNIEIWKC